MANDVRTFWEALVGGGLFSIAFVALSVVQWYRVIRGWMGMRSQSLIPLVGGILGLLGLYASGVQGAMTFWWIPFIVDPGSALMLCSALYHLFSRRKG